MDALKKGLLALAVTLVARSATAQVSVKGEVTDSATKRKLGGAIVQLVGPRRSYTLRTDELGEFMLRAMDPGGYSVIVKRIGYAPFERSMPLLKDSQTLDIVLSPLPAALKPITVRGEGAGIYGQIAASADLRPVAGAKVKVAGTGTEIETDSTGAFFVPVKLPGRFMIRVSADHYADEMYTVTVKKNEVADASMLLQFSERREGIPEGVWKELDQRMNWRSTNNSYVASGSEVAGAGASLQNAIENMSARTRGGMKLGPTVCVIVNGTPRPGLSLNAIRPEEIKAMEIYARDKEVLMFLGYLWPQNAACTETGMRPPRGAPVITYVSIWTK